MSTDPSSAGDDSRFAEFLADYFVECDEHLAVARRSLLALETSLDRNRFDKGLVDELFRSFHSLKGLSAMVGFHEAEQLGHHLESFLGAVRRQQVELNLDGVEALMAGVVAIEHVIAARRDGSPLPNIASLTSRLAALLPVSVEASGTATPVLSKPALTPSVNEVLIAQKLTEGKFAWEITFSPSADLAARGIDVSWVRKSLQNLGEIVHSAPLISAGGGIEFLFILIAPTGTKVPGTLAEEGVRCVLYRPPQPALPAEDATSIRKVEEASSTHLTPANVVRVDLDRLDDLMRLVGELVLSRARLDDGLSRLVSTPTAQLRALRETAATIERQLRELRAGVMRVRMVPIREVFVRMQFVIRDLVREAGKRVSLRLKGEDTQIDKYVVERIMDPLLHLVRNAVSHGVETPDERMASGKPTDAQIQLGARTVGETVVIEVEDDGRGIDAHQILQIAKSRGVTLGKERLDESSLLDILCVPGFSSRDAVDRVSGRGIGMDVVRQTVEELGGTLRLETTPGAGSRFEIQLPLTVSITEALIVQIGSQRYAVPQVAIREIVPLEAGMLTHMEGNDLLKYRDHALPVVQLSRLFRVESPVAAQRFALVIGEGTQAVGLAVERVLGLQEIVVRPLTDTLVHTHGISGATELGDGRVVLILDTSRILRSGQERSSVANATKSRGLKNDN